MTEPDYVLGIDLGGSSVKAVVTNANGDCLHDYNLPFDPECRGQFAETVRKVAASARQDCGRVAACVGLCAPGLADASGRHIAYLPGRLEGLEGLDWTVFLECAPPIPVLNDAHAALLGEIWRGAACGSRNVILLTLGTGVGGAAVVDGQLLRGHLGRAGHLGHLSLNPEGPRDITGTPGSLEDAIGNHNIRQRTEGRYTTTQDLISDHLAGNEVATEIWLRSVRALGAAVASFVNILDPEIVVIGGGISAAGDALFVPLQQRLDEFEWRPGGRRVQVRPARLGGLAGAFGAAWNAWLEAGRRT